MLLEATSFRWMIHSTDGWCDDGVVWRPKVTSLAWNCVDCSNKIQKMLTLSKMLTLTNVLLLMPSMMQDA